MQSTLPGGERPVQAFPRKLYSGAWGARVVGRVEIGATIRITTRGGKSWLARVTTIEHDDGGEMTVQAESLEPKPVRKGRGRSGGSSYSRFSSGAESYQNNDGRCEDAPCCGCCN